MPINIRPRRPFNPKNHGMVNTARSAFDRLMPVANQQYQNALAVDGVPIVVYRRRTTGLVCTCQGASANTDISAQLPPALKPGNNVLDPEGHGTESYLATMLHGTAFSINRYGSRPKAVDGGLGDNPQRSVPHSPLVQATSGRNVADNLDDPFAEYIEDGEDNDDGDYAALAEHFKNVDTDGSAASLTSTTANSCGCCLGTGYVGGYSPVNAVRLVFDARAVWSGVSADYSTKPASMKTEKTFSLKVLLPAGAVGLDAMRLFNNTEQIQNVDITCDGVTFDDVSLPSLCDGNEHTFSFSVPVSAHVTHFELQLEVALEPVYASFSRMTYSENLAYPENLDAPNLIVSPTISHLGLYDIVSEATYRRLWKIISANPNFDRERQLHGLEVQCRLVQKYETASLLPVRRTRTWYNPVSTPGSASRSLPGHLEHNPHWRNS